MLLFPFAQYYCYSSYSVWRTYCSTQITVHWTAAVFCYLWSHGLEHTNSSWVHNHQMQQGQNVQIKNCIRSVRLFYFHSPFSLVLMKGTKHRGLQTSMHWRRSSADESTRGWENAESGITTQKAIFVLVKSRTWGGSVRDVVWTWMHWENQTSYSKLAFRSFQWKLLAKVSQ